MKKILTIAGLDPTGGAGITMDVSVFQFNGIYGLSIPTSIVVQGPYGVSEVYPIPHEAFSFMLNETRVMDLDAVKIGVLYDEPYVEKVSDFIKTLDKKIPIVLDTVFSSKNKTELLTARGILKLKASLIPRVTVLTPNIEEAEALTEISVKDITSMKKAASILFRDGAKAVVIKGGHSKGKPVDILFDGTETITYSRERLDREIHGTGCVFSSLLTSYLCLGYSIKEAFFASEHQLDYLLKESFKIAGGGYYYMSLGILRSNNGERWEVINTLKQAKDLLYELNPIELVPAVQMNLGYAIKDASKEEDIAAFPGRISVHKNRVYFKGEPCFGASSHVARLILGMMKKYPHIRSCANIKYDDKIIKKAKKGNMGILFFDRKKEPQHIKQKEGKSLDFLLNEILPETDMPPDIIYDTGDMGKEPMIRLFGRNPIEVIKKMEMILP
ncbi:MAG TPA: bifunctional hydroxymethylpyrimidine kinase/phosphomethylpyrimidine kinase [Syntrophorhabdaceae bacterium]|nr:bifunctional hydroxymethylpyrimidine kinase/phosphomethylpyrimidine kinase [Syntrophorhabdaceae bacterium]